MNHLDITQTFYDKNLRSECIFHLGTSCNNGTFSHVIREHFDDDWDEIWAAIGVKPPENKDPEDIVAPEDIEEVLWDAQKIGFLVQIATPEPNFHSKSGYSFSWRSYATKWFYGEALEDVYEAALNWQRAYMESQRLEQSA